MKEQVEGQGKAVEGQVEGQVDGQGKALKGQGKGEWKGKWKKRKERAGCLKDRRLGARAG